MTGFFIATLSNRSKTRHSFRTVLATKIDYFRGKDGLLRLRFSQGANACHIAGFALPFSHIC